MSLIVQKYGGTSVANPERIKEVAKRVARLYDQGHKMVVVVSARAGITNKLIELAKQISNSPNKRELDALLATGEQQTVALLAIALIDMGYKAVSLLGFQAEILTDNNACNADIITINSEKITSPVNDGKIVIVAGFQGCDEHGNITTLGRGGSDTSAVAIAAAIKADVCEILTDVDGVYTTNPTICSVARKIKFISYEDMLELAGAGAQVLHRNSVEIAKKFDIPVHLRSSFNEEEGTMVINGKGIENPAVTGITNKKGQALISVITVPDDPGVAGEIFCAIAEAGIEVDVISQPFGGNKTNVSFTVGTEDLETACKALEPVIKKIGAEGIKSSENLAKISVVGTGMKKRTGVAGQMFETLALEGINIKVITTSEIRISVLIEEKHVETAILVLHAAFGLDKIEQ